jgi:hypothetical protein
VAAAGGDEPLSPPAEAKTVDSNGTVLARGDTVMLIKELGAGLKKGTKVTLGRYSARRSVVPLSHRTRLFPSSTVVFPCCVPSN